MQQYLEGLTALHSADMQAVGSRALGRPVRREPITTEHPLVRTHPVTGWKSVFFNPGFVTEIVGIPKCESNAIINYLNEIIATTQESHVRYRWNPNDVAFWDNRVCVRLSILSIEWNVLTACRIIRPPTDLHRIVDMPFVSPPRVSVQRSILRANRKRNNLTLVMAYQKSTRTDQASRTITTNVTELG